MRNLLFALLLAVPAAAHAAPMTNDDVIKMVKSGLGEAIVLQSIDAAEPKFDTGPSGLVKLKQGGASDKVIEHVMSRGGAAKTTASNDDVIKMVKSGLSEAIVIKSIDAAEPKFDTSSDGLVKLKQGGVSDKAIERIMARSGAKTTTTAKTSAAATCKDCGTITEIADKKKTGSASGVGAVAGGVVGGLVGREVVGGTGGTLVGAAGGAVAGHMIERKAKEGRFWEITVKFDDGKVRRFPLDSHPSWKKGTRVKLVNGKLAPL